MPATHPRIYSAPRPPHDPSFLHVLYDNNLNLSFNYPASTSPMLAYLPHHSQWHNHLLPTNPYPSPPPPPSIPHKVWILDCKSCGTFLTNRGMKAVLLLRPNVSLYSSDALPVNCSAFTSNPDALRPRASCRPSGSSHTPPRTCECLTQTLCCHGCGATVGYMIVIPCARCTSSITATNRATNGHRFVFHSSEITGTERHYILDEPGVIPFETMSTALSPHAPPFIPSPAYNGHADDTRSSYQDYVPSRSQSASPSRLSDYLPTPPLELADPMLTVSTSTTPDPYPIPRSGHIYPPSDPYPSPHASPPFPQYILHHPHSRPPPIPVPPPHIYHLASRPTSAASVSSSSSPPSTIPSSFPFGLPADQKEQSLPHKLTAGDIVFWHHLARNGEIPGVEDDERARGNKLPETAPVGGKLSASIGFDR